MQWVEALALGSLLVLFGIEYQRTNPNSCSVTSELEDHEGIPCFSALFSFGSSIADTGTNGAVLGDSKTLNPPYGCTFFGEPSGRTCDGRALIDFWATALKIPFLDPYLKSVGSNFRRGANFASSGSLATKPLVNAPFDLKLQVNQFRGFKRQVLDIVKSKCQGSGLRARQIECHKLPGAEDFRDALYVMATGGNDLLDLNLNFPMQDIPALVPNISRAIFEAVEVLYSEGARNILIENVYPQGCIPYILQRLVTSSKDLDDAGCYTPVNSIVQLHNSLLKEGVTELAGRLSDAFIAVIDTYTPRYEIILHYDQYGFTVRNEGYLYSTEALAVPQLNIKQVVVQGGSPQDIAAPYARKLSKCVNVSKYVMWDNIHFTDAVNLLTMRAILSGRHFYPRFDVVRNNCTMVEI